MPRRSARHNPSKPSAASIRPSIEPPPPVSCEGVTFKFTVVVGELPAATGRKMHFTGTTVLKLKDGKIVEEKGLDDGVTALTQLGLIEAV